MIREIKDLAVLERFIELAELGISPEAFAFSIGRSLQELDHACHRQWGKSASELVSTLSSGAPVRLLTRILDDAKIGKKLNECDKELLAFHRQSLEIQSETRAAMVRELDRLPPARLQRLALASHSNNPRQTVEDDDDRDDDRADDDDGEDDNTAA